MQGNSTNLAPSKGSKASKMIPKEIMNCWAAGTTSGPALLSRSLKMYPADAHTTVFGHFSRPKEALHRYAEKICKFSMKEIQQRTKVMLEFQQLKKNCFARPSFEYGDLGLYNPWWILTLWRREWKSVWLQFQSQSAAIILRNLSPWNAKRRPMILCLGLWLWWGFQMIRSHCQACQLFGNVTSTRCVIRNTHV